MQVDFYHLAATPVERVLCRIAERIVGDGGRLLVVIGDAAQAQRIDRALWAYRANSFLPHAQAGQGDEADEPVLIAEGLEAAHGARHVALADGLWRTEALELDRAFLLFDDARIEGARIAWKSLADLDGVERRFWKQDEAGRWSQMA